MKKAEYEVQFATRQAQKGWTDLLATTRMWFYVEDRTVWLVDVHTRHPNQTKN